MSLRHVLTDTLAYLPPAGILEDLSAEQAARKAPGLAHATVDIVAHLDFWQRWFLKRCAGESEPMPQPAAVGWPGLQGRTWATLRDSYLNGLEQLARVADDAALLDRPIAPALEFPPMSAYTRRDIVVHIAVHNAHHLGQVVHVRQQLGLWPPRAGSWTW
jgi:uncharacterized damage-inducible protein DinB